ncbi:hypothetical protein D3C76_1232480 [compost metagenome]
MIRITRVSFAHVHVMTLIWQDEPLSEEPKIRQHVHILCKRCTVGITDLVMKLGDSIGQQLDHHFYLQARKVIRLVEGFENLMFPFRINLYFFGPLLREFFCEGLA